MSNSEVNSPEDFVVGSNLTELQINNDIDASISKISAITAGKAQGQISGTNDLLDIAPTKKSYEGEACFCDGAYGSCEYRPLFDDSNETSEKYFALTRIVNPHRYNVYKKSSNINITKSLSRFGSRLDKLAEQDNEVKILRDSLSSCNILEQILRPGIDVDACYLAYGKTCNCTGDELPITQCPHLKNPTLVKLLKRLPFELAHLDSVIHGSSYPTLVPKGIKYPPKYYPKDIDYVYRDEKQGMTEENEDTINIATGSPVSQIELNDNSLGSFKDSNNINEGDGANSNYVPKKCESVKKIQNELEEIFTFTTEMQHCAAEVRADLYKRVIAFIHQNCCTNNQCHCVEPIDFDSEKRDFKSPHPHKFCHIYAYIFDIFNVDWEQAEVTDFEANGKICHTISDVLPDSANYTEEELKSVMKKRSMKDWGSLCINFSFASNILLLVLKVIAFAFSANSMTVLASMIDSSLDILSGLVLFIASKIASSSRKNPQKDVHKWPVGKRRAETLGVLAFAIVMMALAVMLIYENIQSIVDTTGKADANENRMTFDLVSQIIILFTIVLKLTLCIVCATIGVKSPTQSDACTAYRDDHRNDVLTNILGYICAFLADKFGDGNIGWQIIDPIGSIVLCVYILVNWALTAKEQMSYLAGKALDSAYKNEVCLRVMHFSPEIVRINYLQGFYTGNEAIIEIHVDIETDVSIKTAHDIIQKITDMIENLKFVERCFVHVETENCFHAISADNFKNFSELNHYDRKDTCNDFSESICLVEEIN